MIPSDAVGALKVSAAIQQRLTHALAAALFDDREVAAIVARAPAITSDAIGSLFLSHAAAVLLDQPQQLPALLDRIDTMRRQLVAIGTAAAPETLQ